MTIEERAIVGERGDRHSLHATNPRNLAAPRVIATGVHRLSVAFPWEVHRILFPIEIKRVLVPNWLKNGTGTIRIPSEGSRGPAGSVWGKGDWAIHPTDPACPTQVFCHGP